MTLPELTKALRHLRLGGMAALLEMRLQHAQAERLAPLDFLAVLVTDELTRRHAWHAAGHTGPSSCAVGDPPLGSSAGTRATAREGDQARRIASANCIGTTAIFRKSNDIAR
jgi:hypothetical protein